MSHEASAPNRQFHRIPFDGQARLYSSSSYWDTEVLDLSLSGALVRKPVGFEGKLGMNLRLELRLPALAVISMGVTVANLAEEHIGLKMGRIDFDSFCHLKRTIELNLGSAELLARELSTLGKR